MEENYKIKILKNSNEPDNIFEGPLDLLLNLIEKRKLFINDISLSQIADDYIQYIKNSGNISIRNSADFVLIASTLMLIKSKSLLPTLNLTLEEEQSIEDLEERLKVYKRMKELSKHVGQRFGKQIIFSKSETRSFDPVFSPDEKTTKKNLFILIKEVLKNIPIQEIVPKAVVRKVISLDEVIDDLTNRIKANIKMSFRDFSNIGKAEKINIVVSFLAMLELVKQGIVSVKQNSNFGDIDIENTDVSTPVY
jgi:segregation and condensation protein A